MAKHVHRFGWGCHRGRCQAIMEAICDVVGDALVDDEGKIDLEKLCKLHDDLASTMDHWKNKEPLFRMTINGGD